MGKLRIEPKSKPPGFLKLDLANASRASHDDEPKPSDDSFEATIRLVTRQGTLVQVSREVPLKQVARLVRLLDGSLRV